MARVNRREVLADGEVQVVHCVNRCVRRGFLCGDDPFTNIHGAIHPLTLAETICTVSF